MIKVNMAGQKIPGCSKQEAREKRRLWNALCCSVLAAIFGGALAQMANAAEPSFDKNSTPPGITLVEVAPWSYFYQVWWIALGDEYGRTLFVRDADLPGESGCYEDCAAEFPPVLAPAGAHAMGDWTLVTRREGAQQWVYKGKPLYRFARETRFNEVVDNLVAARPLTTNEKRVQLPDTLDRDLTLPPGWQIARFKPVADLDMPVMVSMGEVPAISGHALVNSDNMTLYQFDGKADDAPACSTADCEFRFRPLLAAQLSQPVGLFTLVRRANGSRQWAWQDRPLFTYSGDIVPGDVHGLNAVENKGSKNQGHSPWRVAMLSQHFMPANVTVREDLVLGNILSTTDGMPLYSRYAIQRADLFVKRTEDDNFYMLGKKLGTKGCDAECLRTWRPLLASPNDKASGFWEIFEREDGTRQWAYKGYAQFTNVNDKPFESARWDNQVVYVVGDKGRYQIEDTEAVPTSSSSVSYARGFNWRVTDLNPK